MSLELQNVAILSLEYQQPITPTPDITTPPGSASLQDDATDESSHEDPSQDSMEQSTERLRDRCLGDGFSNWCLVWGLWSALLGVGGSGLWLRSSVAASGHASSSSSDNGEGGTSSWRAQEDDTRSGLLLPLVGDNCEIQSSSSPRHKISALQLVLIAVDASPFSNVVTPLGDRGELRGPRVGDLGDDSTSVEQQAVHTQQECLVWIVGHTSLRRTLQKTLSVSGIANDGKASGFVFDALEQVIGLSCDALWLASGFVCDSLESENDCVYDALELSSDCACGVVGMGIDYVCDALGSASACACAYDSPSQANGWNGASTAGFATTGVATPTDGTARRMSASFKAIVRMAISRSETSLRSTWSSGECVRAPLPSSVLAMTACRGQLETTATTGSSVIGRGPQTMLRPIKHHITCTLRVTASARMAGKGPGTSRSPTQQPDTLSPLPSAFAVATRGWNLLLT
eukprot:CAMPEP_0116830814 /NCGR_PEP_ID=MMETSP0418-20121206/4975_1 /TAXON_ID=1158023 /ORGANISM="Astrosyne radiata, Strain 13vi08-1A" /LENGTH=459 /DNA_ID=CAMNT_0004459965 /DNA_START=389 /DNA_END=1770 /DNA_ORIENTATION=-